MFENLSDKLQRVFKNLRGEGKLTAENMEAALREIRVALLEADVHFRVAKQFIEAVKEKAMGADVLTALSPTQQVVKIVRDEMVKMLGTHQAKLRTANEPPSVMMIVGLQGSGKTTSTAKLARWLSKNGHSPIMVSVDVYRPAARKQLSVLARDLKLPIYEGAPEESKPAELARSARKEATQTGRDVLLVDTAGRLHIDDELMTELTELKDLLQPHGNPVRRRRDDRSGRREIGRRVQQAPRHHRHDPDENGWRRARRRGAVDPRGHRPAAEIRRASARNPTRSSRFIRIAWRSAFSAWATCSA